MEQNLHRSLSHVATDENIIPNQKNNKPSSPAADNENGSFDCNICLDSAHEPVVTLCGHLYCWPCIYKWLNIQIHSDEVDNEPKCPVCKAKISQSSLVPLYGRGTEPKKPHLGLTVPRRPPPLRVPRHHSNPQIHTDPFVPPLGMPNNHGNYSPNISHSPTVGMFGEMVFARIFGSDPGVFPYPYLNNYPILGSGGGPTRIRRQEMQLDKSLNRVSIFLFCCFILCLLLF